MRALILSGGGARGAYQVGVINALADICKDLNMPSPFSIYTGVSAGAINAAYMASGCDAFAKTSRGLADIWSEISAEQVFKTDALSMGKIGLKWMGELSFGALSGTTAGRSLLDTEPLWKLIGDNCDFQRIPELIDKKTLHALALTALDYKDSSAITFVQGDDSCKEWKRSRRRSEVAKIRTEHVMASSAIPLLFPPITVNSRYFGDGCVRNVSPCSPAIHLGAEQVFVIGVRSKTEFQTESANYEAIKAPSVARVVNVILNAVMLDGIEIDIERMERINEFLKRVPKEHQENLNFKPMDYVFIYPSEDIGAIALSMSHKLPRIIRYLLKGLGPLEEAAEIISYLLFEKEFCTRLIEMGYKDAMKSKGRIVQFLKVAKNQ